MGFRDLRVFNMALLAKQSWRLYIKANPLLLAIFQARYFKHSMVLEAHRGYAPSYTWRSIWGAKSLLLEGLGWRIGNGSMVDVVKDKWVPLDDIMISLVPMRVSQDGMRVSDLINFDRGEWDVGKLYMLFSEDVVKAIQTIPLSKNWPRDSLFWWHTSNGAYSVKSGYWLGLLSGARGVNDPNSLILRE